MFIGRVLFRKFEPFTEIGVFEMFISKMLRGMDTGPHHLKVVRFPIKTTPPGCHATRSSHFPTPALAPPPPLTAFCNTPPPPPTAFAACCLFRLGFLFCEFLGRPRPRLFAVAARSAPGGATGEPPGRRKPGGATGGPRTLGPAFGAKNSFHTPQRKCIDSRV